MKIVADPNIPFVREAFGGLGEVELIPGRQMGAAAVRPADVLLVRSVTPVNAALLDGSKTRFVATATIGTDHVDAEYLAQCGIGFCSAAGSNASSVAEYIVAAMLELAHRREFRLRDKTLGVIGIGNVGSRVVRHAEALGMRVLQNDPPRQRAEKLSVVVSLDRLLAEADIVTAHVPLTREGEDNTFHLFDARRLAALSRTPILINTSRGAVVDNAALLRAIQAGTLGGVVLDVWENEPNISQALLNAVDLGSPHIAGYSLDGKVNGTTMIYRAVCAFLGIKPTWNPAPLMPAPEVAELELDAAGRDDEEVIHEAIRRLYDIRADDSALRQRPREFDRLRADYPVRREFFNTRVLARQADPTTRAKLASLGFEVS